MVKTKIGPDRKWKLAQQASTACRHEIKIAIKKAKNKNKGVNSTFLESALNCYPSFIGCFAEDELIDLRFNTPCFLIVNVDSSHMKGSHWLAIGIFEDIIEIFDPLGFEIFNWSRIPSHLLNFLHRLSVTRTVLLSKKVQPNTSTLCGFYCLFYLYLRNYCSFKKIQNYFAVPNDKVIIKFFL